MLSPPFSSSPLSYPLSISFDIPFLLQEYKDEKVRVTKGVAVREEEKPGEAQNATLT